MKMKMLSEEQVEALRFLWHTHREIHLKMREFIDSKGLMEEFSREYPEVMKKEDEYFIFMENQKNKNNEL